MANRSWQLSASASEEEENSGASQPVSAASEEENALRIWLLSAKENRKNIGAAHAAKLYISRLKALFHAVAHAWRRGAGGALHEAGSG